MLCGEAGNGSAEGFIDGIDRRESCGNGGEALGVHLTGTQRLRLPKPGVPKVRERDGGKPALRDVVPQSGVIASLFQPRVGVLGNI